VAGVLVAAVLAADEVAPGVLAAEPRLPVADCAGAALGAAVLPQAAMNPQEAISPQMLVRAAARCAGESREGIMPSSLARRCGLAADDDPIWS
jgi:hypothetical protein